jgi:hypothetical protein
MDNFNVDVDDFTAVISNINAAVGNYHDVRANPH